MIPTDDGGAPTAIAWMPVLLTAGACFFGLAALLVKEILPHHAKVERVIADRVAWWFIGAGCGMGGLFVWWMVT